MLLKFALEMLHVFAGGGNALLVYLTEVVVKSYVALGFLLILKLDLKSNKFYQTCFLL